MTATELKAVLEKAAAAGIIVCKQIESLRCPAKGYPLIPDWCNMPSADRCNRPVCVHRLHVTYADRSAPNILDVRYINHRGVRVGFIYDDDEQLCEVLRKIL